MKFPFRHLALEGVIGAGKTTLATLLAEKLYGRAVLESFSENPFLPRFYADPERYGFPLEVSFLAERFQQLKNVLSAADLFGRTVVSDYVIQKSALFARITLDEAEQELFQTLYQLIDPQLPPPDLLIYLNTPLSKLRVQIGNRGRDYEQSISDEYLQKLGAAYERFLYEAPCPVLIIDMTHADFLRNPAHLQGLLDELAVYPWRGQRILNIV